MPAMVPVIQFDRLQPPAHPGELSDLSHRLGASLIRGMGNDPHRADDLLEVLAVWVAAIIAVHPSTKDYLGNLFMESLSAHLDHDAN